MSAQAKNNLPSTMNDQGNKVAQREKPPKAKLQAREDCNLNDREFTIAVWKNSVRQFNELRNKIYQQKNFTKEAETIKRTKFWS